MSMRRRLVEVIKRAGEWRPLDLDAAREVIGVCSRKGASRATSAVLGLQVCQPQAHGLLVDAVTFRDECEPHQVLIARLYAYMHGGGAVQHWSVFPTSMNEADVLTSARYRDASAFLQRPSAAQTAQPDHAPHDALVWRVADLSDAELMRLYSAVAAIRSQRIAALEAAIHTLREG